MDGISLQRLHRNDSRLATAASLDHCLMSFQSMEAIDFQSAVADGKCRFKFGIALELQYGIAPGDRYRGTRQERNLQLLCPIVHELCVLPAVGEMLVVEERH